MNQKKQRCIIFDESHDQVWALFDTGPFGLSRLACLLEENGFTVSNNLLPLDKIKLDTFEDTLVLGVAKYRRYSPGEIKRLEQFVLEGGRLLVLGEHEDIYRVSSWLQNPLLEKFGLSFSHDFITVQEKEWFTFETIFKSITPEKTEKNITARFYTSPSIVLTPESKYTGTVEVISGKLPVITGKKLAPGKVRTGHLFPFSFLPQNAPSKPSDKGQISPGSYAPSRNLSESYSSGKILLPDGRIQEDSSEPVAGGRILAVADSEFILNGGTLSSGLQNEGSMILGIRDLNGQNGELFLRLINWLYETHSEITPGNCSHPAPPSSMVSELPGHKIPEFKIIPEADPIRNNPVKFKPSSVLLYTGHHSRRPDPSPSGLSEFKAILEENSVEVTVVEEWSTVEQAPEEIPVIIIDPLELIPEKETLHLSQKRKLLLAASPGSRNAPWTDNGEMLESLGFREDPGKRLSDILARSRGLEFLPLEARPLKKTFSTSSESYLKTEAFLTSHAYKIHGPNEQIVMKEETEKVSVTKGGIVKPFFAPRDEPYEVLVEYEENSYGEPTPMGLDERFPYSEEMDLNFYNPADERIENTGYNNRRKARGKNLLSTTIHPAGALAILRNRTVAIAWPPLLSNQILITQPSARRFARILARWLKMP